MIGTPLVHEVKESSYLLAYQGFIQRVGGPGIPHPQASIPPPENLMYSLILMHSAQQTSLPPSIHQKILYETLLTKGWGPYGKAFVVFCMQFCV